MNSIWGSVHTVAPSPVLFIPEPATKDLQPNPIPNYPTSVISVVPPEAVLRYLQSSLYGQQARWG